MKFHILIYGCQMNYSDSARIKSVLLNSGFEYVDNIHDSNIVIFDTCSVRQKSEDKIFGKIMTIPKDKKIWISGCMVQHNIKINKKDFKYRRGNFLGNISNLNPKIIGIEKLDESRKEVSNDVLLVNFAFDPLFSKFQENFPNVELIFRIDDIGFLPYILKKFGYKTKGDIELKNEYLSLIGQDSSNQLFSKTSKTAFVPIQVGCSQFCSYCIVPFSRGLEKNRNVDEIVNEVKTYLKNGVQEIVLLGQIVNKHKDFLEIIKKILPIDGLKRLRYTSPYPTFYSDELLVLHEKEEKLCPHIHAPLQSGSDYILKKMFRGYNSLQYKKFVDKVKKLNRQISLTTDIIVGFSYEKDEHFQETLDLIDYAKFDFIFIGIYSPRPGTYGAKKYIDDVSTIIKKQRWNILNNKLAKISLENNKSEIGKIKEIMIIEKKKKKIIGYSDNMKNTIIEYRQKIDKCLDNIKTGNFIKTKIIKGGSLSIFGEIV